MAKAKKKSASKPKKKTAKKAAPKAARKAKPRAPAKPRKKRAGGGLPQVRVQMFRQGLGDCFLLTFGDEERHMLIDCGTLGKKSTTVEMADIAAHLETITKKKKLDVVIATHEHKDHLSGFNNAAIKKLAGHVDEVWLAWTENPKDKDAQAFAKNKRDLGAALAAVATALPRAVVAKEVTDLLGFAGDVNLGAAKFAETIDAAMDFVRTGLGAKAVYHEPGDLIEDWMPGFRIYVLGPPRSSSSMKDLGSHESEELYNDSNQLRSAALLYASGVPAAALAENCPFDMRYTRREANAAQACYPGYSKEAWRTIDEDWLGATSDLALQLDSMTNNSSLALAIERIADGRVLLFPADAQQGNWLSWHEPDLKWLVPNGSGRKREVTAADLLARTVFYKVGHHASHNATARGKGLELMEREDELVAFIPVDREIALSRNPKDSWQMPARPLYRRLLEKCQGRVARSDLGWAAKATGAAAKATEREFDDLATGAEWSQWQKTQSAASHVQVNDLFIEYLLE